MSESGECYSSFPDKSSENLWPWFIRPMTENLIQCSLMLLLGVNIEDNSSSTINTITIWCGHQRNCQIVKQHCTLHPTELNALLWVSALVILSIRFSKASQDIRTFDVQNSIKSIWFHDRWDLLYKAHTYPYIYYTHGSWI